MDSNMKYMKRVGILASFAFLLGIDVYAQDDIVAFDSQFAFGSAQVEFSNAIEYDASGNIFIYGEFSDDMNCDPTGGEYLLDPEGQPDLFLGKYDDQGVPIWAFGIGRVGLNDGVIVGDLQVDSDGNIYITGSFSSFVDFDPSEELHVLTSLGGQDAFVAKYSTNGALIWVNQYGTPSTELSTSVALDGNNNLAFSLRFSEAIDLDLGDDENILTPWGVADVAAVKIDPDGNFIWSQHISTAELDDITEMEYNSNGELAIGATINGVSNPFPVNNMYLAVIGTDGILAWDFNFNNLDQNNQIAAFDFDSDNTHIYIGGRIQGSTDFDPSDNEAIIDPLFADPFFAKYDLSTGDLIWANYIESSGTEDYVSGIAEAGAALYVIGSFDVVAKFDVNDFASQIPSAGGMDLYMAAYDRLTGEYISAESAGGPGSERSVDSEFDSNGLVYTTGAFSTSIKLDSDAEPINAVGFADIFFAKFTYETTLSAGDIGLDAVFSLFPVPVSKELQIQWGDYGLNGSLHLTVTNVVGQTVKDIRVQTASNAVKMDVSELKPGIYILSIETRGGVSTKRFVKN